MDQPECRTERFRVDLHKRDFHFDSAHFIVFTDGSREPLHGHNYQVGVRVEGPLGDDQMVADFTRMKPIIRQVCAEIDHVTLIAAKNRHLRLEFEGDLVHLSGAGAPMSLAASDVLVLPIENTSVESLAGLLADRLEEHFASEFGRGAFTSIEVEVEETPGQSATCMRDCTG